MMSVSNVKKSNSGELALDRLNTGCVMNVPGSVPHAVFGGEVRDGRLRGFFRHQVVHRSRSLVREKHGTGLRVQSFDMSDPVIFFVWPRQFVLFDRALQVLFATGSRDKADL